MVLRPKGTSHNELAADLYEATLNGTCPLRGTDAPSESDVGVPQSEVVPNAARFSNRIFCCSPVHSDPAEL